MKFKILLLFCIISNLVFAQENFGKIQLRTLSYQLKDSDNQIEMRNENGKIYYYDIKSNKKLFSKGFEIAYPFFKQASVVQENGKYGIIDKKGNFMVVPTSKTLIVYPRWNECQNVYLDSIAIDLNTLSTSPEQYLIHYGRINTPFEKGNKWGVKNNNSIILIPPIYDSILTLSRKTVIASKKHKIGILDLNGKQIIKFRYNNAIYSIDQNTNTCPIVGLERNKIWTYFENGKEILKSKYRCLSFHTTLDNSIGIFQINKRFNILFKNGKTLDKFYDFIYPNGMVGTIGNKIYLLKSDGSSTFYYKKNKQAD